LVNLEKVRNDDNLILQQRNASMKDLSSPNTTSPNTNNPSNRSSRAGRIEDKFDILAD
jgi:hypothetical protein